MADTLELFYNEPNGTRVQIPLTNTGIAWWTDKHVKFRNPGVNNQNLTAVFQGTSSSFLLRCCFCSTSDADENCFNKFHMLTRRNLLNLLFKFNNIKQPEVSSVFITQHQSLHRFHTLWSFSERIHMLASKHQTLTSLLIFFLLFQEQQSRWTGAGQCMSSIRLRITTALSTRTSSCGWEPPPCRPSANSTASSTSPAIWFPPCPEGTTLWRSSTVSFMWSSQHDAAHAASHRPKTQETFI